MRTLTKIDYELCNLEPGNPLFPRDPDAPSSLKIIPVHDCMDRQVKGNGYPRHRGVPNQLRVAEKCCGSMVIGVEEGCKDKRIVQNFGQIARLLKGFFFSTKKTVSRSSTYLVK